MQPVQTDTKSELSEARITQLDSIKKETYTLDLYAGIQLIHVTNENRIEPGNKCTEAT